METKIQPELSRIPDSTREALDDRQRVAYSEHRKKLVRWMAQKGKNPKRAKGYAESTIKNRIPIIDRFLRWVWNQGDKFTTNVTHDLADGYMEKVVFEDWSDSHKSNVQKTLVMYFRWRADQFDEHEWEPYYNLSDFESATTPKDYLQEDERKLLREAAVNYGSVPHYNAITPEERQNWKRRLAQQTGKPMDEINKQDFERANGFKIPSMVYASLDAGFRPAEVERAKPSWIDLNNQVLRIPAEDAVKSNEPWTIAIREDTTRMLEEWLKQRDLIGKYDGSDALWLTRHGNRYQSTALKHVLNRLLEEAGIEAGERSLTWYAIRHSTATYMVREDGLASAQAQLRHTSLETTAKYDQAPVGDRRGALDEI